MHHGAYHHLPKELTTVIYSYDNPRRVSSTNLAKAESLRLAISVDILFREAKPSRHLRAFLGAAIGAWPQLHAGFQSEHV